MSNPSVHRRQDDLCAEIKRQGMTHKEFCEKIGWCPLTISRWRTRAERGRAPWIDEIVTAWKALGYSLTPEPIEGARVDRGSYGRFVKSPLDCPPIVARIFFEQEQLGWTRKKLAAVAGIGENTIGRMATGESRGKYEHVEACFNAMGFALVPVKIKGRSRSVRPMQEIRNEMQ
jgi:hypothetical protein